MAYTVKNFPTKVSVKRALANGEKIECYEPGPFGPSLDGTFTGTVSLEGPHYPEPHKWYGQGVMENGLLVKIS